ncbi:hypothetical protein [Virgibacillus pantothenticus]|uniref:hypothetical protein n=1 Tax=Virgibacillus pantothenticus TaxID=1473 RepID=UPI000986277D|nr:hypothetical protein [Virgibacillus pantothenticus]
MGGCCCASNGGSFSPIMFFATSTETPTGNLVGAGPVDVLTLGVSPPSPGQHQVKLDSTVELILNKPAGSPLSYNIEYRLQKVDVTIATLTETRSFNAAGAATYTLIPNLTWNDTITVSATYTVEIQVITISPAATTVTAQTRALNAIVF